MSVTITRTINNELVRIELTEEEIEKVFRHQDLQYMKGDAKRHLLEKVDGDEDDEDGDEELKEEFKEKYGIDFDELINDEDLLEYLAERFSDEKDCNIDENITWDFVIDEYLASLKAGV